MQDTESKSTPRKNRIIVAPFDQDGYQRKAGQHVNSIS